MFASNTHEEASSSVPGHLLLFLCTLCDGLAPCPFDRHPLSLLSKWRTLASYKQHIFMCLKNQINELILASILTLSVNTFV